jgi:hypothetical protein
MTVIATKMLNPVAIISVWKAMLPQAAVEGSFVRACRYVPAESQSTKEHRDLFWIQADREQAFTSTHAQMH